jgi:hypothetical protein
MHRSQIEAPKGVKNRPHGREIDRNPILLSGSEKRR